MDYYKQKKVIRDRIKSYLAGLNEIYGCIPESPSTLNGFVTGLVMETGFSENMIKKEFELFGVSIVEGRILPKEAKA